MNRLLATFRLDITLQYRNGFYFAALVIAAFTAFWLRLFFAREWVAYAIPPLLLATMGSGTFYLFAGMALLEKREGTLEGIVVTPLRPSEYLISKLVTMTLLVMLENISVLLITYGFDFNWLSLLTGIMFMSIHYSFAGFILVTRYNSITDFLMPSVLVTMALQLPIIDYLGILNHWLFYLIPTQAPLLLIRGAFEPAATWIWLYAISYSILWSGIGWWWAYTCFHRFIIRKEGDLR